MPAWERQYGPSIDVGTCAERPPKRCTLRRWPPPRGYLNGKSDYQEALRNVAGAVRSADELFTKRVAPILRAYGTQLGV